MPNNLFTRIHALASRVALAILLVSCAPASGDLSFNEWFRTHYSGTAYGTSQPPSHELVLQSPSMKIDTIYRSMQGPYHITPFDIDVETDELIWVTGYRSVILDAGNGKEVSGSFMCHNNLDHQDKTFFPWKVRTLGTSSRLFTLSEGQTDIRFPEGFGLPVPSGQTLSMFAQVLNHNLPRPDMEVRHQATLTYLKQSELNAPMKPLYSQVVFVTKQTGEKAGASHCGVNLDSNAVFNPFMDSAGNHYTGHWKIDQGEEVLTTEVTQMMDLPFDTRIHCIGVHLHPFAISLSLYDLTNDSVLYTAEAENYDDRIGIRHMPWYASKEGIPVYRSHRYALKSVYNNTDSIHVHTAMATMVLYLEDH